VQELKKGPKTVTHNNKLTPWSRLLEKLVIAQLANKFPPLGIT